MTQSLVYKFVLGTENALFMVKKQAEFVDEREK